MSNTANLLVRLVSPLLLQCTAQFSRQVLSSVIAPCTYANFRHCSSIRISPNTDTCPPNKMADNFSGNSYMKPEDVPGLNLQKAWNKDELLDKLEKMDKYHVPLLQRNFTTLAKQTSSSDKVKGKFRLMQWNMLAQGLSRGPDNFVRCPSEALDWDFRRLRILEEILKTDPDVLCLQEVDHFGFLHSALKSVGYQGFFFPKPDSPALYSLHTNGPDGCAMFYKENKFNLVKKDNVILRAFGQETNQVSIVLTLETKDSQSGRKSEFTVATTHLKARAGWDELRQKQGEYLLEYLADKVGSRPLIVCGDLNAESSSPVYSSFRKSKLGLLSAYTLLSENKDKEPPFTTLKFRGGSSKEEDICRTIDYIWFTKASLEVQALNLLPTPEEVGKDRLPNFCYPSDHLSLAADFEIKLN